MSVFRGNNRSVLIEVQDQRGRGLEAWIQIQRICSRRNCQFSDQSAGNRRKNWAMGTPDSRLAGRKQFGHTGEGSLRIVAKTEFAQRGLELHSDIEGRGERGDRRLAAVCTRRDNTGWSVAGEYMSQRLSLYESCRIEWPSIVIV
jgi:hypothetical protein